MYIYIPINIIGVCVHVYVVITIKSLSLCCWRRSCFLSPDLKTVSFIGNKDKKSQTLPLTSSPWEI